MLGCGAAGRAHSAREGFLKEEDSELGIEVGQSNRRRVELAGGLEYAVSPGALNESDSYTTHKLLEVVASNIAELPSTGFVLISHVFGCVRLGTLFNLSKPQNQKRVIIRPSFVEVEGAL